MKPSLFMCLTLACAATAGAQVPPNPPSETPSSEAPGLTSTPSIACTWISSVYTGSVLGSNGISLLLTQTRPTSSLASLPSPSSLTSSSMSTPGSSTSSPGSTSSSITASPSSPSMTGSLGATGSAAATSGAAAASASGGGGASTTSSAAATTPTSPVTAPAGTTWTVGLPPCPR